MQALLVTGVRNVVSLSLSPNTAFLGAAELLWDLTLATGGAVAALEGILGVGCEEAEHERGTTTYGTGI